MHSTNHTGTRKAHPGMTEWGAKARKAEAKTKRKAARTAAIAEARNG
jgi:hypothetical protein